MIPTEAQFRKGLGVAIPAAVAQAEDVRAQVAAEVPERFKRGNAKTRKRKRTMRRRKRSRRKRAPMTGGMLPGNALERVWGVPCSGSDPPGWG